MTSIINASTVAGVVVSSDTSGNLAIQSNGTTIATAQSTGLSISSYTPATSLITSGTAQASTSGTSITFTGIPSWVKRITMMLIGVSSNGTNNFQVQIGSGSLEATGYTCVISTGTTSTTGYVINSGSGANTWTGNIVFTLVGSNLWTITGSLANAAGGTSQFGAGNKTTSSTLDRIGITTVDTFDAGSINILYE